ncbi:DinB family protein [uncultured Streptomyces sp.]|uniref:DinB family protein n=1 Tax=uncultured Streptomyces sp. TaxID=174707 RepID=UPI002614B844|nr:DinB family protein [uncultured Streptomyces sp.]
MPTPRTRPDYSADERTQLVGWLDLQRSIVRWKCEGISEEDAHRAVLPGSPLMTVAGIVSHLRWTEHGWFQVIFRDQEAHLNPQYAEAVEEDADFMADGIPLDLLLEAYDRECTASNSVFSAHAPDAPSQHPRFTSGAPSLRWIVLHMIEETARHAGHLDAIREILDGERGYY